MLISMQVLGSDNPLQKGIIAEIVIRYLLIAVGTSQKMLCTVTEMWSAIVHKLTIIDSIYE